MVKISEQRGPECLAVGFIARQCGVSNTTVLRWISAGQLHAFRLPGGHFRVAREDFSDFLYKNNMPLDNLRKGSRG